MFFIGLLPGFSSDGTAPGLLAFGMPGLPEMVILAIVAFIVLVLFGNRLPNVMRNLGRGIVEFKKGARGVAGDLEDAVHEGEEDASSKEDT